ncbi:MAG: polyprenyl synthetase family protein [Alphaproteobacteria bacterium]|nr:polyprenyl synthetase family protein [Alphaproteobacteria bacterium]
MNAGKADLAAALAAAQTRIEAALDSLLPRPNGQPEDRLAEAMRYATLGGGKRLRAFLVLEGARLCGVRPEPAAAAGAAVEMLHAYSLVHDDLPCMDDDDLRRGKPTVHKAFDEATAVLAGDALLTLAFEVLAGEALAAPAQVRAALTAGLARAAGAAGMVGGQMFDLLAEHRPLTREEIGRLQRLKTGALIVFAAEAGALLGEAPQARRQALADYGGDLGLAFQIADDILDVAGEAGAVGKKLGKDAAAGKATFVSLLGLEEARRQAQALGRQACDRLAIFGESADVLRQLAQFVVDRRN